MPHPLVDRLNYVAVLVSSVQLLQGNPVGQSAPISLTGGALGVVSGHAAKTAEGGPQAEGVVVYVDALEQSGLRERLSVSQRLGFLQEPAWARELSSARNGRGLTK